MTAYTLSDAEISGPYRYRLRREWTGGLCATVLWIMLNPSTADAEVDDPTIRRCVGFSKEWGYGGLVVVNLFAFRATNPKHIPKGPSAIGPGNDDTIRAEAAKASMIVAAWGGNKAADRRGGHIAAMLDAYDVQCLGETKAEHPVHPLFLPAVTPLRRWREG